MRMKKIASAVLGLAFAAGVGSAQAVTYTPPNTTPGEEAMVAVAESILSLTAGLITASQTPEGGCAHYAGSYPVVISTTSTGNGNGSLDYSVQLDVTNISNPGLSTLGTKYQVTQSGTGGIRDGETQNFNGRFAFGVSGFIMAGGAFYDIKEFGQFIPWDELIIKDFWQVDGTFGKQLLDDGLEVITKLTLPQSKWRQTSRHIRPDGGNGLLSITKELITPVNTPACKITLTGAVGNSFGGKSFSGSMTITP